MTIKVGLVGAGTWARRVHAPNFAAGPETTLVGVWSRRREASLRITERHGGHAYESFDDLLAASDAIVFCVPPDVQVPLAIEAANAGRALLLEKPVANSLDDALRLQAAVEEAGVPTMYALSMRFCPSVRGFVERVRQSAPIGARGWFLSGTMVRGPFATPWRMEDGVLLDAGPHLVDLLDAALGRVSAVKAHQSGAGWVGLLLDHEGGVTSELSLSAHLAFDSPKMGIEAYSASEAIRFDGSGLGPECMATMRAEFAAICAGGESHPIDLARAVHIQRVLTAAIDDLRSA